MRAGLKDMQGSMKFKKRINVLDGLTTVDAAVQFLMQMLPRLPQGPGSKAAQMGIFDCWASLLERQKRRITELELPTLVRQALSILAPDA
eukprot:2414020-Prorocentrum_lima.AAC.1